MAWYFSSAYKLIKKSYTSVENVNVHPGSTISRLEKRACSKTLTSNVLQL
jgi:hypothetical protein